MKKLLLIPTLAITASCTTMPPENPKVVVDISDQKLKVLDGAIPVFETSVETSRKGIGHRIGSNRTPTGEYTLVKEANHRFGPSLRLSGYQGYRRGILIHKNFRKGDGTSGCICPEKECMEKVFELVKNNTPITIKA